MKAIPILLLTILLPSTAGAGVTALNQIIKANQSWTVPEGKTVILTHTFNTGDLAGILSPTKVFVDGASATEFVTLASYGISQSSVGGQPIHFGPGTRIENKNTERSIVLFGKLADSTELFAALPASVGEVELTATELSATLRTPSAHPAKIVAEESEDLQTWTAVAEDRIVKTGAGTHSVVVGRGAAGSKKFLRARAHTRPSS